MVYEKNIAVEHDTKTENYQHLSKAIKVKWTFYWLNINQNYNRKTFKNIKCMLELLYIEMGHV